MFGTNNKYLVVSINDGVIKLAEASSSGSVEKVARGSYSSSSGADEGAKSLKSLLVSFDRKAPVICVIPASAATAKNIEVPSTDPEEIKSIINLQASRHTPYSKEEVLISHINLGIASSNNTKVLLVIVHRDIVKERIAILEKSGLDTDKIIFTPEAQARFYVKALNLKKEAKPMGLIDFSLNTASFMVIAKGSLQFVRHIPIGVKALAEGADAVAKFQEELKKSMDAFAQEDGNGAPDSYHITTSHDAVNNILPGIKDALNVELKVNSFVNLVKGSAAARKKLQNDFAEDSFLDVIAPASTVGKCEVNLMPEEMILKKTVERQSREAIVTGVSAVIIMVLFIAMAVSKIYFKETFLNKNLREQFAPQKAQVKKLQEEMNKAKLVRSYIKTRMVSLDIIHELYAITPNSIYLNNISVDEDGMVTIDGIAESMSQVFSYVKSLDDSAVFKEAKTKSTSTKKDNGKDVASFEIEFKMNSSTSVTTKEPA